MTWTVTYFFLFLLCIGRTKHFNMPRSPTSSEDEMAQSFSDYSVESESDSSKEETIYDTIRATAEKPSSRMEDSQSNTLVIRIIIPDLQQTVRQSALQLNKVNLIISFPGFSLQYICFLFLLFFLTYYRQS